MSYDVLVRRKGQFRKIATVEDIDKAFNIGSTNVRNTASASFKVKPVGSNDRIVSPRKNILNNRIFYKSKREPGVFIQERSNRISSPGEKREITFKGIFSNKMKSFSNKLFGR